MPKDMNAEINEIEAAAREHKRVRDAAEAAAAARGEKLAGRANCDRHRIGSAGRGPALCQYRAR